MMGRWQWIDRFPHDVKGSFRLWRKHPLITAAALLTLALGTGMNIGLFRVVWSVLLKPLPYSNASQLVHVWHVGKPSKYDDQTRGRNLPEGATVEHWRNSSRSFDGLATFRPWRATVGSRGDPERVTAGLVSAEFFPVLGIHALFGRTFTAAELRPGTDDAIVLSYGYWQERFAGDSDLIDKSILIDGQICRVVGILPADFRDYVTYDSKQPNVYLPISKIAEGPLKVSSGFVIGRLKRGVTIDIARSELAALELQNRQEFSKSRAEWDVEISRLQDDIGLEVRPALLVLLAATGCILLIACTNIANLLLAQAAMRRQELAIRAALGANRTRLICQLFTESLVLALVGSLAGLVAASTLSRAMVAFYPDALPRVAESGERIPVLVFAMIIAGLSAVFFGTVPALLATRQRSLANLRTGKVWMERSAGKWRSALMGVQVAMTAMILISAGLLLKSFAALRSIDLGFEHARIFTAQVVLPESAYSKPDDQTRFALLWIDRLKTIPGVEGAAVTNTLPLAFNVLITLQFSIPGQAQDQLAGGRSVAGDYFEVMGLSMKEGRPLSPADNGRRDVVVVNETFARHFLKDSHATGMPIHFGSKMATIVGVVHDLRNLRLKRPPESEIYFPFAALPSGYLDVVARTALPPADIAAVARHELRALDPGLVLTQVSSMDQILDENLAQPRFLAVLLSLFAFAALLLAAIGVYGIIAQGIKTRMAEFAIRMTLGARESDIFWMTVQQGLRAPLFGLTLGVAGAWVTGRMLESFLFGVAPRDPLVVLVASVFVFAVCLFSCGVPAFQASRLKMARALRDE